jgi:hypothetical protein
VYQGVSSSCSSSWQLATAVSGQCGCCEAKLTGCSDAHTQDPLKYGWDNYGYSEDGYSYEKHYPKASYGKDR